MKTVSAPPTSLVAAPDDSRSRKDWTDLVPHRAGVFIRTSTCSTASSPSRNAPADWNASACAGTTAATSSCRRTSPRIRWRSTTTPNTTRRGCATATPRWRRRARSTSSTSTPANAGCSSASPCRRLRPGGLRHRTPVGDRARRHPDSRVGRHRKGFEKNGRRRCCSTPTAATAIPPTRRSA